VLTVATTRALASSGPERVHRLALITYSAGIGDPRLTVAAAR